MAIWCDGLAKTDYVSHTYSRVKPMADGLIINSNPEVYLQNLINLEIINPVVVLGMLYEFEGIIVEFDPLPGFFLEESNIAKW